MFLDRILCLIALTAPRPVPSHHRPHLGHYINRLYFSPDGHWGARQAVEPRSLRATISLTKSALNIRSSADSLAVDGKTTGFSSLAIAPCASLLRSGEFQTIVRG